MGKDVKKLLKIVGVVAIGIATAGIGLAIATGATLASALGTTVVLAGSAVSLSTVMAAGAALFAIGSMPSLEQTIDRTGANARGQAFIDPNALGAYVFGRTTVPMALVYEQLHGTNEDRVSNVMAHAWHEIHQYVSLAVEGETVTFSGDQATGEWSGIVEWRRNRGNPGQTAIVFGGGVNWPSSAAFAGVAHSALTWNFFADPDGDKLKSGVPTRVDIVVEGARLYDPRRDPAYGAGAQDFADPSTWAFNNGNAVLVLLRYLIGEYSASGELIWGRGASESDIDMASFVAMANVADELDPESGVPKFRLGGMHLLDGDFEAFVRRWEHETGGKLSKAGGVYRVWLPHDDLTPLTTITDDDLLAGIPVQHTVASGVENLFNTARGRYIEPTEGYRAFPYPEVSEPSAVTDDGGKRVLYHDFSWVQDVSVAQRIARIKVRRSRFQRLWTLALGWKGQGPNYRPFTVHTLRIKETGGNDQLVRVVDRRMRTDGVTILTLQQEDASIYDDTLPLGDPHASNTIPARIDRLGTLVPRTVGDGGAINFTPVLVNVSRAGSKFTKTGGADFTWGDASFRSVEGYQACRLDFRASQTNLNVMVGLTTDPGADDSFSSIDYALYCNDTGNIDIYENGVLVVTTGPYTTSDQLSITYDGVTVRYYQNGTLLRSVVRIGVRLFLDSSFHRLGAAVNGVSFGPFGVAGTITGNLLRLEAWQAGSVSSSVGNFEPRQTTAGENEIVNGVGPFGASQLLWQGQCLDPSFGIGGESNGGWDNYNDAAGLDPTKTYRSTVWFKFTSSTSNWFFHGCSWTATANLDGSPNTNPYFVSCVFSSSGLVPDKWYLSVGFIHGSGYSGGQSGLSGIWDPQTGRRVVAGQDFKMLAGATTQTHRTYMYYGGDTAVRALWTDPRFEIVDGNEPPIPALLSPHAALEWRRELIHDDFVYLDAAQLHASWIKRSGGIPDSEITLVTGLTDVPGGTAVRFGNNSGDDMWWGAYKEFLLPYDPNSLYEVGVIVRRVAGSGKFYCGLEGIAADGVTLINTSGASDFNSQHYIAASNKDPPTTWTIYRGFVKGHSTTTGAGNNSDPRVPAKMYTGTVYVRPLIIVNFNGQPGQTDVAALWVKRLPGPQAAVEFDIYHQSTAPPHAEGRIWVDTDDSRIYRSNGTSWVQISANTLGALLGEVETSQIALEAATEVYRIEEFGSELGDPVEDSVIITITENAIVMIEARCNSCTGAGAGIANWTPFVGSQDGLTIDTEDAAGNPINFPVAVASFNVTPGVYSAGMRADASAPGLVTVTDRFITITVIKR